MDSHSDSRRACAPPSAPPACGRLERFMTEDGFSFTYKYAKRQLTHTGRLPAALPGLAAQQLDAESESGPLAAYVPPGSSPQGAGSSPPSLPPLTAGDSSDDPSQDGAASPGVALASPRAASLGGHAAGPVAAASATSVTAPTALTTGGANSRPGFGQAAALGLPLAPEDDAVRCPLLPPLPAHRASGQAPRFSGAHPTRVRGAGCGRTASRCRRWVASSRAAFDARRRHWMGSAPGGMRPLHTSPPPPEP